ncbi:gluconokinase [Rubricella aquisinus]|uniref:Gluconokinase n=1 Tax=Rubricella aquisinus TaxID=2028108 RepID=A0A840WX20_9RHOB|nr:gluconokinase [Rubricella aquisinus]
MPKQNQNVAIVVMGVCGVGKTSVARVLAGTLEARYIEADDFHSPENREAMAHGIPLSDEMRFPWLNRLAEAAEAARAHGHVVMACSALKRSYRDVLRAKMGQVQFLHLTGERGIIADRLGNRRDHFISPSLLDSQLQTLEAPTADEHAIVVDVSGSREEVDRIVAQRINDLLFQIT